MEVVTNEKRKDYEVMTNRFGFSAMHTAKCQGFTLAEVLITLGIIGVVAAMTIPTLISNTNGAKFRSQFKKTLSTLNQAGLMAQAQYDFDYAGTTAGCGAKTGTGDNAAASDPATEHPESTMTFCAILNGTLTGQTYLGKVSTIKRSNNGAEETYKLKAEKGVLKNDTIKNYLAYSLADGAIVAFDPNAQGCELPIGTRMSADTLGKAPLKNCLGFIDVNGATLPNKEVTCSAGGEGDASVAGKATNAVETPCVVKNDANHMTDVFPIVFHDATVEPASNAAKYVLTTSK